jgi:hypothetical protein
MASTPLYKGLKANGTSFYAFPGAAEDISAAYQNSNYKMYFSKYVLLNFPKRNLTAGTQSNPIYFDFDSAFTKSQNYTPPTSFSEQIVESLRNYVANQEVVIRESRLNNTDYYYNTNSLETTTEKIFFKWCKKLGLIDFEPAVPDDEYFSNLPAFERRNLNDDEYFPEYLWKEREVIDWDTVSFYETGESGFLNKLEIQFNGETNFKVGDTIRIFNVSNSSIYSNNLYNNDLLDSQTEEGKRTKVLRVIPSDATRGQRIVVDIASQLGTQSESSGQAELVYHRLIQYVGEINGVSNVQEANRSYTEVYAHIPDHTGATPDILFRTMYDVNYKPNLVFPIVPSQYQAEIMGAETFTSPIVSSPTNYPGSYFGQFDTLDFTYETSTGDTLRRSGDYFGVNGDINNPTVDTSGMDGITLDFNTSHYVKMNLASRVITNFEQFNALEVNNTPPSDFEFNAILWYYTVEDDKGNTFTNLYGISFLDNPGNNLLPSEVGIKFPTYKKLVSSSDQDGTSFAFSLNLNFNIINDNIQDTYNPEAINSMFSMNLFNKAMQRLSSVNDSFLNILVEQNQLRADLQDLKSLLYSQTDLNIINSRINSLNDLLRLYATNQIISSDTIRVTTLPGSPPNITLDSTDPLYNKVDYVKTTDLYSATGIIPLSLDVPTNKSWLVYVSNNDEVPFTLPNNDKLTIYLSRDLDYKQSVEFFIQPTQTSSQNKKMDIYVNSDIVGTTTALTQVLLVGNIDLPVSYNLTRGSQNSSYLWKDFNFDIDFNQTMTLKSGPVIDVPFEGSTQLIYNSIKSGDTLVLNNFFVGTSSVYDFSGQYTVSSVVGSTSSYISIDVSNNLSLKSFGTTASLPMILHSATQSMLSNKPYFSLNKGKKIVVTRISNTSTVLSERYRVEITDLK